MKKLLSLLLFCSLMIMGGTQNVVHAEDDTESTKIAIPEDQIIKNDESGIPDPHLYYWAVKHGDEWNGNKDGILTKEEALKVNNEFEIGWVSAPSTVSLKGLSYFENIKSLGSESGGWTNFPNRHIKVANYDELKKLEKLESVSFIYADNVDLKTISELSHLKDLSIICSSFQNKNDLSLLINLKRLDTLFLYYLNDGLNAYDLDNISSHSNIKDLSLQGNNITTIKPLTDMKQLTSLDISNNTIKSIDGITKLNNLINLNVSVNLLKTLPDLKKLNKLEKLDVSNNFFTEQEVISKVADKFKQDDTFMKNAIIQNNVSYPEDNDNEIIDGLEKPYNNSFENVPSDFIDKIYDSDKGLVVSFTKSVTISSDIFKVASKEKKVISFEMLDESGELKYSWTFDGKSDYFIPTNTELNLEMSFDDEKKTEIEKLTNFKDCLYMKFAYHGKLPLNATMKVKVDDRYKDGDIVYLYYFNEEKNTIEQDILHGLIVKDRYVEFDINHCSTYFLSKEKIGENKKENQSKKDENKVTKDPTKANVPETADTTQMIGIFVGGLVLGTIGICVLRKKRII